MAMCCRLGLRKFSQKPPGFVSSADYAMGVGIGKRKGNVTDCEFHMMEMETCQPARLVRWTAENNFPGPSLPFGI